MDESLNTTYKCKEFLHDKLIESGNIHVVKKLLRSHLLQQGWLVGLKKDCVEYAKRGPLESLNISHMTSDLCKTGKDSCPANVRDEIKKFLFEFAKLHVREDESEDDSSHTGPPEESYADPRFNLDFQSRDAIPDPPSRWITAPEKPKRQRSTSSVRKKLMSPGSSIHRSRPASAGPSFTWKKRSPGSHSHFRSKSVGMNAGKIPVNSKTRRTNSSPGNKEMSQFVPPIRIKLHKKGGSLPPMNRNECKSSLESNSLKETMEPGTSAEKSSKRSKKKKSKSEKLEKLARESHSDPITESKPLINLEKINVDGVPVTIGENHHAKKQKSSSSKKNIDINFATSSSSSASTEKSAVKSDLISSTTKVKSHIESIKQNYSSASPSNVPKLSPASSSSSSSSNFTQSLGSKVQPATDMSPPPSPSSKSSGKSSGSGSTASFVVTPKTKPMPSSSAQASLPFTVPATTGKNKKTKSKKKRVIIPVIPPVSKSSHNPSGMTILTPTLAATASRHVNVSVMTGGKGPIIGQGFKPRASSPSSSSKISIARKEKAELGNSKNSDVFLKPLAPAPTKRSSDGPKKSQSVTNIKKVGPLDPASKIQDPRGAFVAVENIKGLHSKQPVAKIAPSPLGTTKGLLNNISGGVVTPRTNPQASASASAYRAAPATPKGNTSFADSLNRAAAAALQATEAERARPKRKSNSKEKEREKSYSSHLFDPSVLDVFNDLEENQEGKKKKKQKVKPNPIPHRVPRPDLEFASLLRVRGDDNDFDDDEELMDV